MPRVSCTLVSLWLSLSALWAATIAYIHLAEPRYVVIELVDAILIPLAGFFVVGGAVFSVFWLPGARSR